MQNAEYRMLNAYTACGILPGEEMVLSGSTESVITVYISPSGKHEPQREDRLGGG